jgi:hypothetical protein
MSDNNNLESLIDAAVSKALGSPSEPAAPAADKPAPQSDSLSQLTELMKMDMQMRLADRVAAYKPPPGAPSAPQFDESDPGSFIHASREQVAKLMQEGKLTEAGNRYARSGGAAGPSFVGALAKKAGSR